MDYIRKFDIELEREYYYAGERLKGCVVIENIENIKVRGIRVMLRGKAHVEWKVTRSGERRTVKEDQYFIDEKAVVWGKDKNDEGSIPIMPRGNHRFQFDFPLPESSLPCSFESKIGTVRYYLRVHIDIPYASPPQGLKYFTVIGPHIDCMDERYLVPVESNEQWKSCCLCCLKGPIELETTLERSAYCCGESIKLKAEVQNGSDQNVVLVCRLLQTVEFRINKGVLPLTKEVSHTVWEFRGPTVPAHSSREFNDLHQHLQVPVMPATVTDVCRVLEIYYALKVSIRLDKSGEFLDVEFPIDIATVPYRIPNAPPPQVRYEVASDKVEGGMYISPEFQLGQVYDGTFDDEEEELSEEDIILYRPIYVCVPHVKTTNAAKKKSVEYKDNPEEEGRKSHAASSSSSTNDPSQTLSKNGSVSSTKETAKTNETQEKRRLPTNASIANSITQGDSQDLTSEKCTSV